MSDSCRISLTTANLPVITVPEPEMKPAIRSQYLPSILDNKENKELSTALRRRRDRFARQATHIQQQELLNNSSNTLYSGVYGNANGIATNGGYTNGTYASTKPYSNQNTVVNGVTQYTNGVNGIIGTNGTNGTNGHQDEDEPEKFVNRTAKTLNLADVFKNGLFVF